MKIGFVLLSLCFAAATAFARDLDLLVEHRVKTVGADGVTRTTEFAEHVVRRKDQVWIERVIPAGARETKAHANSGHDDKHLDLGAAARWITLEGGKTLNIHLVNAEDKVVVSVPAAEYDSIGFDGNWDSAWHLLDPRQLQAMKPVAGDAPSGMRWYESDFGSLKVRVLWDEKSEIPRRVESGNKKGTTRKLMSVQNISPPKNLPWTLIGSYRQRDYTDYLD
jgi:hypothetical protein